MAKEEKKAPKLRFNGYTNDWERKELNNILKINSGRDYKQLNSGNIPVYGTGGYMLSVNDKLSDTDAVGIGRKGTIDKPLYLKAPFWTVDTLFYCTSKENSDVKFIYLLFQIINWKRYDESTGVPSLSKNTISNIKTYVPKIKEQDYISKLFFSLDNTLQLHERKCEELALIKQALLQKLFPKKDEVIPEVRYKSFSAAWEQRKLGEVATFINGRAYKQNELLDSGKYKVLRVGNFYTNDSWYYSNLELADKYYIDEGDLVYTWSATFGPHIWNGEKVIYHYHIWKIELSKFLDRDFTLQILEADKAKLLANTNGSTMIHVTKKDMESKVISLPNIEEQKKIGSYLMKFDSLITLHQRKLEKLKQLKKFLLQNMFI
ncbi:restriction endonuclease subunit S [Ligilactobacillus salivarius]|uniref:Restriction endonuclease subunit S n=1 Tax=Ligilactobacillus salivarius TaxID=1624 RepID=A0A1V9RBU8_9LACO|nr:restriction endonuclease subunit S [Ligilactobacillus salivarius]OQQ90672.1 restriction endonuclease subunit S [Ligilactobacillus salivarius]